MPRVSLTWVNLGRKQLLGHRQASLYAKVHVEKNGGLQPNHRNSKHVGVFIQVRMEIADLRQSLFVEHLNLAFCTENQPLFA